MPLIAFQQIAQPDVESKIRHKYQSEITALKEIGAVEMCFFRMVYPSFSCLTLWPYWLLALRRKEVVETQRPLRFTIGHPLLVFKDRTTYMTCSDSHVEFCTCFTDGTIWFSLNESKRGIADDKLKFHKYGHDSTIDYAWKSHCGRTTAFMQEGKQISSEVSLEEFAEALDRAAVISATVEYARTGKLQTLGSAVTVIWGVLVLLGVWPVTWGKYLLGILLLASGGYGLMSSDLTAKVRPELRIPAIVLTESITVTVWIATAILFIIALAFRVLTG